MITLDNALLEGKLEIRWYIDKTYVIETGKLNSLINNLNRLKINKKFLKAIFNTFLYKKNHFTIAFWETRREWGRNIQLLRN